MSDTLIADALAGRIDHTTALRQFTLQRAVMHRINCPDCGSVMDQSRATVIERNGKPAGISCNGCYTANVDRWAIGLHTCTAETIRETFDGLEILQWDSQRPLSVDVLAAMASKQQ